MIIIFLGNVGSGKTANCVREIMNDPDPERVTYSNIITKKVKNNIPINASMIIKKEQVGQKKNGEPIYKYEFNKEFWQDAVLKNPKINVIIDEAHTVLSARRAMSKSTQCMLDFLALIRRIVGQDPSGQGRLILISQLERRIDVIAKEMCNQVRFHICHYIKTCNKCGFSFRENNEVSELALQCPRCKHYYLRKHSFTIEVMHFPSMDLFIRWKYMGANKRQCVSRHYQINDIENYFKNYNTLQWDNLLTDL
jgi:predicted Zn-ribbon and HTH transcriptional regulator